jgi:hypothetical protein
MIDCHACLWAMAKPCYPCEVIGGPPLEKEADHFIQCPACGARLGCRQPDDILLHEEWHGDGDMDHQANNHLSRHCDSWPRWNGIARLPCCGNYPGKIVMPPLT